LPEHAEGCTGRHWCEVKTHEGFWIMEGGRRESGDGGLARPGGLVDNEASKARLPPIAAANPAALEREQAEDCPLGELHHGTGFQALRHDRRIRALEAERDVLKAWIDEIDELPPEQRIIRAMLRDEVQAYWVARAEKAERERDVLKARIRKKEAPP